MTLKLLFVILTATFTAISSRAESRIVDEQTQQALEKLGKESSTRTRSLLTPPYGAMSSEIQKAREEIRKILVELGGNELKAFDGHWVVNIYADSAPNAWVKMLFHEERTWNGTSQKIEPYRRVMKLAEDGKPIYEFGFSTGLFKLLKSKDQLAFVIGHELTHLLENHLSSETGRVSSQQHELVADAESIRKMVGKYALKAGAEAMTLILSKDQTEQKPGKILDMIISGANSHHHEGQRISALQFAIEHYLRSDGRAQSIRQTTPIPDFFHVNSRQGRSKADPIFTNLWETYYKDMLVHVFLDNNQAEYLMQEGHGTDKVARPSYVSNPTKEQKASLLLQLIQIIESKPVSKSEKVNAFLQSLILMSSGLESFSFSEVTPFQMQDITRFLLRNSVGVGSWRYSDYAALEKWMKPKSRVTINKMFLGSAYGQTILGHLAKVLPEWTRLFQSLSDVNRFYFVNSQIDLELLQMEILRAERSKDSPFIREHILNLKKSIKLIRWKDGEIPKFELLEATHSLNGDKPLKTKEIFELLKVGEKKLPTINTNARLEILNAATQIDLLFNNEFRFTDEKFNVAIELLKDPTVSLDDRKKVFYLLAIHLNDKPILSNSENEKNLSSFLNSLSKEDRLNLLTEAPAVLSSQKEKILQLVKNGPLGMDKFYQAAENIEKGGFNKYLSLIKYWASLKANTLRLFQYGRQTEFIDSLSPVEIQKIFASLENHGRELFALDNIIFPSRKTLSTNTDLLQKHRDASSILIRMLAKILPTMPFSRFHKDWTLIRDMTGEYVTISPPDHERINKFIQDNFADQSHENRYKIIQDKHLRPFLEIPQIAEVLVEHVRLQTTKDQSLDHLAKVISELSLEIELKEKPELHAYFRNEVSKKWNLQPDNILKVFPIDNRTATKKTDSIQIQVRVLSSLLAAVRGHSARDQLQLIDYLMGRNHKWPSFVDKIEMDIQESIIGNKSGTSFTSILRDFRNNMKDRSELERSALINSFLTGPTGLLNDPKNLSVLTEQILSVVSAENREFSQIMMDALFQAEGTNKSIFLSYVLAQKSESGTLSEALILKSLLDAYGVPGVKLAQYLSFTDEFKSFKTVLETYQDAALPLTYYEMLELVRQRLGDKWNSERFRVVKVLGTGSVNIAVEYKDLQTGKVEVLNISRDNIVTKSAEDFHRFSILLKALREHPVYGHKFEFVVGLMGIISKSVSLEFDKKHAFEIQREVQALYNRNINGWKVRTVNAFSLQSMTILMEKAAGEGARHILKSDPKTYRSAMTALLNVEDAILRGVGADSSPMPIPLHANPDIHDGQVLIDTKEQIVTLVDFGQAERISNTERQLAIELLRFVSGIDSPKAAKAVLESRFKDLNIRGHEEISEKFLLGVLVKNDKMDRFVRLASGLNQRGFQVPLSSIHWVLAVNRAVKLGKKIGVPLEASYRNLLLTTKVGLSLKTYNRAAGIIRPLPASQKISAPLCSQIFSF